jgi:hypothetical protein
MKYLLVIIASAMFVLQGCKDEELCLIGSGTIKEYEVGVEDFENISLFGPINLRIKQGPEISVIVDAEPEIFTQLSYEVKNNMLEIGFKENVTCFETDYGVWVNVTLPNLKDIYQSGVSEIRSDGDLILSQLQLNVSGTATIELSGQVDHQSIVSSGVVNASNFALLTKNTTIDVSGTADIELSCSDKLDIEVDGAAYIYYKGNPTISQDASGTLELIDAN